MNITEYIVKQLTKGFFIIAIILLAISVIIGTLIGYFFAKW